MNDDQGRYRLYVASLRAEMPDGGTPGHTSLHTTHEGAHAKIEEVVGARGLWDAYEADRLEWGIGYLPVEGFPGRPNVSYELADLGVRCDGCGRVAAFLEECRLDAGRRRWCPLCAAHYAAFDGVGIIRIPSDLTDVEELDLEDFFGVDGEAPGYPTGQWREEIARDEHRLGYWSWVWVEVAIAAENRREEVAEASRRVAEASKDLNERLS